MIDAAQLRTLGWDDALIEEVNRVAENINKSTAPADCLSVHGAASSIIIAGQGLFVQSSYDSRAASGLLTAS